MKIKDKISSFSLSNFGKSSIIVLILKMMGVLIFFLLSIFITNNFDASYVGRYDFARSVLLIVGGLNLLGFEQSIIYYSGKLRAQHNFEQIRAVYLKMLKVIFLVFLILLTLIILLPADMLNHFFEKDLYDTVLLVIIAIFFHSVLMLNIEFFRANDKLIVSESIRNLGRYVGFFMLAVIILHYGQSQWLAEVFLLNYLLLAIATSMYVYFSFFKKKVSRNNNIITIQEIVLTSYPMALSTMTFFLLQNTDVILLSKFVSYSEVAYYGVAVKVAMLTAVVMTTISIVIAPKVSEIYEQKDKAALAQLMRTSARIIFIISAPLFIMLLLLAPSILSIFGEEYVAAASSLYILIIGQFGNACSGPTGTYLNMTGKQKVLQYILLFAFVLNILLNIILIPLFGIIGAAIATAITTTTWNAFAVFYVYKKDKVRIFLH